ncbi:hypothetical protein F5Y08DRAFT_329547 [Xylaria arbuscula]|nr:hypothetical protein F5Y08DRAFT_329547 [Xylaria arbuscula]
MASTKNTKHSVRKSRQSTLPTIKFRSRCARMETSCRYSVSLRTGKPACDLIKALNGGVLTMPSARSTHTPPLDADTLTMADLFPHVDSCQTFQSAMQTPQDTSSSNTSKCSGTSTSGSGSSPVPVGPFPQMDSIDFEMGSAENNSMGLHSAPRTESSAHNLMDMSNLNGDLSMDAHQMYISMIDSSSSGFSLPTQPATDLDYFTDFEFSEPELLRAFEIPTPDSLPAPPHDNSNLPVDPALQPQASTPMYGHSCLSTAKQLQKSILAISTRNDMMQSDLSALGCGPTITTTDQALLMCSNASQRVVEILKCQCKADAHLPFLITVLISKILATYGAIAKADDSTPFNFGTVVKTQQEQELEQQQLQQLQQQQQSEDAFAAVPLRLGSYDVDRALEETLRAHIVLHELLKLKGMVQLFSEKYCQSNADKDLGEGGLIYSALGQFVEDRYAATMAACELRSSTPGFRPGEMEVE